MSRTAALWAGIGVSLWALAGCGGGEESEAVRVEGYEYGYELPDRVDGGFVTMEFANSGDELHEWALGRLKPGQTVEDLRRELLSGKLTDLASVEIVAGVPASTPGAELTIGRELEPGEYVFYCSMPAPDGRPHFLLGMISGFTVEGTSDAEPPVAQGTITAREKRFEVPTLEAGSQTVELVNAADEPRAFKLLSLKPGKRSRDLRNWFDEGFRGDPPADLLGVIGTVAPGGSAYATLTFEAGRTYYLFDGENKVSVSFRVD